MHGKIVDVGEHVFELAHAFIVLVGLVDHSQDFPLLYELDLFIAHFELFGLFLLLLLLLQLGELHSLSFDHIRVTFDFSDFAEEAFDIPYLLFHGFCFGLVFVFFENWTMVCIKSNLVMRLVYLHNPVMLLLLFLIHIILRHRSLLTI